MTHVIFHAVSTSVRCRGSAPGAACTISTSFELNVSCSPWFREVHECFQNFWIMTMKQLTSFFLIHFWETQYWKEYDQRPDSSERVRKILETVMNHSDWWGSSLINCSLSTLHSSAELSGSYTCDDFSSFDKWLVKCCFSVCCSVRPTSARAGIGGQSHLLCYSQFLNLMPRKCHIKLDRL